MVVTLHKCGKKLRDSRSLRSNSHQNFHLLLLSCCAIFRLITSTIVLLNASYVTQYFDNTFKFIILHSSPPPKEPLNGTLEL